MAKGIFITGTDTNIGKTVISAGLTHILKFNNLKACYFKPILSGGALIGSKIVPQDTRFVKIISGLDEDDNNLTPYIFKTPVSPHLASKIENINININTILQKLNHLKQKYDYIISEGCGGIAVPLTPEGYMQYDLIKKMNLNCILVARSTLGTINHTILTVKFANSVGIVIKGIIINGYSNTEYEDDNINTIKTLTKIPIIAKIPKIHDLDTEKFIGGNIKTVFENNINLSSLLGLMNEI